MWRDCLQKFLNRFFCVKALVYIAKVDTFNDNTAPGGGFEAGVPGDGEDGLEAELAAAGAAPR